jgi:hypothetical protein
MIDFSTDVGKVRLRCADIADLPFLPDEVYVNAISENNGNLPSAAQLCAQYLLGMFAVGASHKKMVQLEIWNKERFDAYRQFLLDTISNPALMSFTALPVVVTGDNTAIDPLKQFTEDWNTCWSRPETVTDMVHRVAGNPSKHPWDNV